MSTTPVATYRLQLHGRFRFEDARRIVPYLRALGVSHVYLSPIASARPGSEHGYDGVDPGEINPELGAPAELAALIGDLHAAGMGVLLDIVPNHLAADPRNRWWRDLLSRGRRSRFSAWFDVDWDAGDGRLIQPVLGRPFAEALAEGELTLAVGKAGWEVRYFEHAWPLARRTWHAAARARTPEAIAAVLAAQPYRLAFWRSGNERVNYRRFFDVGGLCAMRVEDEEVFEAMHALTLRLARRGAIDGVRIDHLDGLRDPVGYLARLRARLAEETGDGRFWTVVEKILVGLEELRPGLSCDGDSGYAMLGALNALFVDPDGLRALDALYAREGGSPDSFARIEHAKKKLAMARLFPAETRRLADRLARLAAADPTAHDVAPSELLRALVEVTASLPVYRTYHRGGALAPDDAVVIARAVARAKELGAEEDAGAVDFLGRVLRLEVREPFRDEAQDFLMRWQQLTGPVMAKGVEDTALYVYGRLFSLNEVGVSPEGSEHPVARFHAFCARRRERWPRALGATSTHDTKRSEDVRARIHVLSEMAPEWGRLLRAWSAQVPDGVQDRTERVLMLQTLLGAWPLDRAELGAFEARIRAYLVKAAREAKVHTSWRHPNEEHEAALAGLAGAFLRLRPGAPLKRTFLRLARRVSFHGALNALGQVVLKVAAPGVPDFYQGTELWSLRLVDPDNRLPVDFALRARLLRDLRRQPPDLADLRRRWRNGRIKLWVTSRALAVRSHDPSLFLEGEYLPLAVDGRFADSVCAFARRHGERWAIAIGTRLSTRLVQREQWPLGPLWKDTTLRLPRGAPRLLRDALTDRSLRVTGRTLPVAHVLGHLPVGLLVGS